MNITNNFNVHVGPYAAYMVSGKTTNDSNFGSSQSELDTDDFNKVEAGVSGGVGIDLDAVHFGARYNYGLTKIGKDNSFISSDAKNSVVSVYVGLRLN